MNSGLQFGIHHHLLYAPSVLKGRFDGCVGIDGWLSIHHFRRRISRLRADDRFEFLNDPFVDGMKIGWSTAAAAVPYAGPALSFAMKILTPVLFAMANGTVDTLLLVNGNKVQLFKTAKGVHVNPTGFASALETLMNSKMFDSKDQATFKSVNEKMQARRDTSLRFPVG